VSALAEALVAAQRRALAAMEKQYAAGKFDGIVARQLMNEIGLNDDVDQDRLLNALDIIRQYGAPLPAEPSNGAPAEKRPEPATEAQLALIRRLVQEKNAAGPDQPLTKQEAHEVIDTLKAGTYDEAKWSIPF
jgi:Spy/CpxP family protein refolding chaperone